MRRIRSDQSEIGSGASELPDFFEQIPGHAGKITCGHEIQALLQINAVNDELRVTAVALPLAIELDGPPVIIERAFRTEAADNSKSFHWLITDPPSPKLRRHRWILPKTNVVGCFCETPIIHWRLAQTPYKIRQFACHAEVAQLRDRGRRQLMVHEK